MRQVPEGRVVTYGQIAAALGNARRARMVGWAMRACPEDVPWHRVVNAKGGLSTRSPSGTFNPQQAFLEDEGVQFTVAGRRLSAALRAAMVDVEGGYTLLPELAVLELPAKEYKRIRQFEQPVPLREVSMVHVRSAAKRSLMERIRGVILEQLPESILDKGRGQMVEWK